MDAFNFVNFLKNPGDLSQVTFQELNNLIEQYPFCQNLHYLALRKAQNENHQDFIKKLELAATYSPNRQWLYKQLQEAQLPIAISDEEKTEVKEDTTQTIRKVIPDAIEEGSPTPLADNDDHIFSEDIYTEELEDESDEDLSYELAEGDSEDTPETLAANHTKLPPPSHSISDDVDETTPQIGLTDEQDDNLENPEDMKLPDDKDKRVIYMEDFVDQVMPPKEEFVEEQEDIISEPNNSITTEHEEDDTEVESEEVEGNVHSSAVSDTEIESHVLPEIPFEIIDTREVTDNFDQEEIILNTSSDIPNEGEVPEGDSEADLETEIDEEEIEETETLLHPYTDTAYPGDEANEQADEAAPPSKLFENQPLNVMKDEEENNLSEDNIPEEETEEEDLEIEKKPTVAPLPKSAFNSWRNNKDMSPPFSEKKKEKKKKKKTAQPRVIEVENLFKEKKKKKKKKEKKKKKKDTKRFAMESLLEHEDVISETLAEIVAEQGSRKKAIKMYNRLLEIHPEKKEIYLNRIEELKKTK